MKNIIQITGEIFKIREYVDKSTNEKKLTARMIQNLPDGDKDILNIKMKQDSKIKVSDKTNTYTVELNIYQNKAYYSEV